ncbi:MAG: copper amine oxidase N-terminal domain-containing protein, partial [Ruminococcaceae bacterium]|nr:copper amine oxidase N-terminal domain-containing protein [Oscillospiraceae bacterium]
MLKAKMKGFILGVCVALILTSVVTAFAVGIDVHIGGIRIYWDGVEKTLRDANGEKVEPMIYNGTTYVPLRAMSQLLGKKVEWDQATTSVYVGGKPVQSTLHL